MFEPNTLNAYPLAEGIPLQVMQDLAIGVIGHLFSEPTVVEPLVAHSSLRAPVLGAGLLWLLRQWPMCLVRIQDGAFDPAVEGQACVRALATLNLVSPNGHALGGQATMGGDHRAFGRFGDGVQPGLRGDGCLSAKWGSGGFGQGTAVHWLCKEQGGAHPHHERPEQRFGYALANHHQKVTVF